MNNNKDIIQKCLGKKLLNGVYVTDSSNDKHDFSFSTWQHRSAKPIYLDAYYGYYGSSSVSMFNNEFFIQCMTKTLNKHIPEIIKETEEIMNQEYEKALLEAKVEAEDILKKIRDLGVG